MKLYAVRDRLLDYFMQPFAGPNEERAVMASLARTINTEEENAPDIAQAPHQFELWCLAIIDTDTGEVSREKQLICDCASLVRGDVRRPRNAATPAIPPAAGARTGTPAGGNHQGSTERGTPAQTPPGAPVEAPEGGSGVPGHDRLPPKAG